MQVRTPHPVLAIRPTTVIFATVEHIQVLGFNIVDPILIVFVISELFKYIVLLMCESPYCTALGSDRCFSSCLLQVSPLYEYSQLVWLVSPAPAGNHTRCSSLQSRTVQIVKYYIPLILCSASRQPDCPAPTPPHTATFSDVKLEPEQNGLPGAGRRGDADGAGRLEQGEWCGTPSRDDADNIVDSNTFAQDRE